MTSRTIACLLVKKSGQGLTMSKALQVTIVRSQRPLTHVDPQDIVYIWSFPNLCSDLDKKPILLDSTPESPFPLVYQPRTTRPRRNMPPNSSANEDTSATYSKKKDTVTETITLEVKTHTSLRANFKNNSPSEFLTPLVDLPSNHTLGTEITLSWSSQKSTPTGRASRTPIQTMRSSSGSNFTPQLTADVSFNNTDKFSEISSPIDSELKNCLGEFD